jgi:acetyl esterase
MPLHPQAVRAIQMAGDIPTNLSPTELRRAYTTQRIKMLPPSPPIESVENLSVPHPAGPIPVRFYRPDAGSSQLPALVFFHGGGWMLGSLDSYDTPCRRLALKGHCAVLSVGYRLAPENPFPAAIDDAYAATWWCSRNAARLGIDPARIAVCGDSAGGNLAASVAQMSHDSQDFQVALQALIYPAVDLSRETASYERNASGYMLTAASLRWLRDAYIVNTQDRTDPRASPMLREDLTGLPRALIIGAEFDPLVDENAEYARLLQAAGVPTRYVCFPGMIHPFFTLGGIIDDAARAEDLVCEEVRGLG